MWRRDCDDDHGDRWDNHDIDVSGRRHDYDNTGDDHVDISPKHDAEHDCCLHNHPSW